MARLAMAEGVLPTDSTVPQPTPAPQAQTVPAPVAQTTLQSQFGIGEALLNDPIYGKSVGTKGQPGYIPGLQDVKAAFDAGNLALAQDLFAKSKWGKLDSTTQKRYLDKIQNSDLYNKTYNAWANRIKPQLLSKGLQVDDAALKKYFDEGIDDATIFAELSGKVVAKGAIGDVASALDTLRGIARNNGFNLEKDFAGQIDGWLQKISQGESVDDFSRLIRAQAKLGLPDKVGNLLDQGFDLANIYAPYRNAMASVLEVTPDSINLDDPLLRSAYGPDKEMSIYDFKRALRKDPRWQYTDGARQETSNAVLGVLRDFGFQG